MRNFVRIVVPAVLVLSFGCSPESASKNQKGEIDGKCDFEFVQDYNDVNWTCRVHSESECLATAKSFVDKYPNTQCLAEQTSTSSVNDEKVTASTQDIQDIIDAIESRTSPGLGDDSGSVDGNSLEESGVGVTDGGLCSSTVIIDYNEAASECRLVSSSITSPTLIEMCKTAWEGFKADYPGLFCKASVGGSETYISESDIDEKIQILEEALDNP
jgi:hypothetical protein